MVWPDVQVQALYLQKVAMNLWGLQTLPYVIVSFGHELCQVLSIQKANKRNLVTMLFDLEACMQLFDATDNVLLVSRPLIEGLNSNHDVRMSAAAQATGSERVWLFEYVRCKWMQRHVMESYT